MIIATHRPTASAVMLSVHDLHEEIVAGMGNATCAVRTLDGVSCDVCAGELLVLQGGVASGAKSLLDVFAGLRTRVQGVRRVHHDAHVRRGAISPVVARAIVAAWSDPCRATPSSGARHSIAAGGALTAHAPEAFLLRVRPGRGAPPQEVRRWRDWASRVRARNAAVVLSVEVELDHQRRAASLGMANEQRVVREPHRLYRDEHVRVLTLRAGRLVAMPARESPALTESGDASAPTVCDPSTRASTAP